MFGFTDDFVKGLSGNDGEEVFKAEATEVSSLNSLSQDKGFNVKYTFITFVCDCHAPSANFLNRMKLPKSY